MTQVLKISTWNVNSVRIREQQVANWLHRYNIDMLLMQEIKCINEQFPYSRFEDLGYNCYIHGQKSYNGVAILSKYPVDEIITDFPGNPLPMEARYLEVKLALPIGYSRIISVYVPNGGEVGSDKFENKLKFLDSLHLYLLDREIDENLLIGGDFNVAPFDEDAYSKEELKDQTCFSLVEKERIRKILNSGLIDPSEYYGAKNKFTWWDYRAGAFQHNKGLRIDYFLMNLASSKYLNNVEVHVQERAAEKASDHVPVTVEFMVK